MASQALQGDGTLSGIGAATSLLALAALVLYHTLDRWWADRVAALVAAAIAAVEAWHAAPGLTLKRCEAPADAATAKVAAGP
jgi:divalent metal cation (Fe/Co/Zn/Cd) transporter